VVSLLTFTAPTNWGFLSGSTLAAGLDYGPGSATEDRTHVYVGATLNTPLKALTVGASFDSVNHLDVAGVDTGYLYSAIGYATYKFNSKMSLNVRGEYAKGSGLGFMSGTLSDGVSPAQPFSKVIAVTGTLQYDIWMNVISRLEVRWDHAADGSTPFGGTLSPFSVDTATGIKKNDLMVAANLIFKF
jgi:hypothetical protein